MKSKKIIIASLLILSLILIAGLEANEGTFPEQSVPATEIGSASPSFSPSFNGVWYSSTGSPRPVAEYLFGNKSVTKQSILGAGTSELAIDIPSGWNPADLSARISNLHANRSYTRNSNFLSGSEGYPYYWTNQTATPVKTGWENTTSDHDVYLYVPSGQPVLVNSFGRWNQTAYVNGSNLYQAELVFRIRKAAGGITGFNATRIYAYVYLGQVQVFSLQYSAMSTSYTLKNINVTSYIPNIPAALNLTLKMGFSQGFNPSSNVYIYFDDVTLYVSYFVTPGSVDLRLNAAPVVGQQYGQGTVHLPSGALSLPFVFTSNSTLGSINFACDSAIKIGRIGSTGLVTYAATLGSTVNYNVSRSSTFNSSGTWNYLYTHYGVDALNVSIPRDWTYNRVVLPNNTVIQNELLGQVRRWDNNSYNWVIMINVTAIRSYGPSPYVVVAQASNYLSSISTYRSAAAGWTPTNLFTNGSRIRINCTVQPGGASRGMAYVVFYNVSDYSIWLNMSNYAVTPTSNGSVLFNFKWSDTISPGNFSKSDLQTLVLWSNGSEVGVNWVRISFDLTPPNMKIVTAGGNRYLRALTNLTISNFDAYPRNMSLYVNGINVGSWTSNSTIYDLDTTKYSDGPVELRATGWDQVDHMIATVMIVYIDNTPPILISNLPSNGSYVHEEVPLTMSCTDTNLRGVTLFINNVNRTSSNSGSLYFNWMTALYTGATNLTVIGSDKAGNLIRITSQVIVDNIPPVVGFTLSTVGQYVGGNRTLNIVCSDAHFKNVTLLIDGAAKEMWLTSSPSYSWNTEAYEDGVHTLGLVGWDLAGNVNQTTLLTVYVDNTPPSTSQLVYPNNGESFNSTTLGYPISWYAASDAGSGVDHYVLQLDTAPSFNSINLRTVGHIIGTSYSIPGDSPLSNGTWYWRVSAVDAVDNAGAFSQPRSFQVIVKLAPPAEGLPVPILIGLGVIPTLVILSSVVLLRKRKRDAESAEYDVKNIMAAYVFSSDGRAMFSHPFTETRVDPQLLSGILTAISEVMKEVVGGDRRPLSTIERSDAKVIVEFGSAVMGALVTKKASREYRRRLRAFLARFEDVYGDKLAKWDGNESIFQAAPEIIEEIFCASARVTTYPTIAGLEDLLASGKLGGVAVSVAGKTGSGKTEFCLRYAASLLKRGNAVIAFAASIPPKEIREQLKSNGVDVEKVQEKGALIIYDAYSGVSGAKSEEKYKFGSPGELNNINLALSRNLGKLEKATIFFDSLSTMIDYSDLELAVDFVRTVKVKLQQGGHVAFFIIDSNAHDEKTLNYILHVMDGEIETVTETKEKGELERLVSFKRLKGFQVKPGYHELR